MRLNQLTMASNSSYGPEDLSQDLEKSTLFISVLVGIFAVLGIFGNSSVFYVYLFRYPRCNFKYFIVSLAVIDMMSCVTTLPGEIVMQRIWFNLPDSLIWLCKVKTFFNGFTVFISAFLLLLIAVDRFRKVCRPLKWQIKPRRAVQLCFMIFGVAIVLAIPSIFLWGRQTAEVTVNGVNMTVVMCEKDDNVKNTVWPRLYVMAIFFTPSLSFMVATVVLYGLIMKEILCGSLALKNIAANTPIKTRLDIVTNSDTSSKIEEESSSVDDNLDKDDESEDEIKANKKIQAAKTISDKSKVAKKRGIKSAKLRLRRKTLIMFVLTTTFTFTVFIYFAILYNVSAKGHTYVLKMRESAGLLFFIWRLYFINHVINPFVYGIMDNRFRDQVLQIICRRQKYSPK